MKYREDESSLWFIKFPIHINDTNEDALNLREYYKSRHWKRLRNAYKKYRKYKCKVCGFTYKLNLHHLTYKRFSKEPFKDLVWLCPCCHKNIHKLLRKKRNAQSPITGERALTILIRRRSMNKS